MKKIIEVLKLTTLFPLQTMKLCTIGKIVDPNDRGEIHGLWSQKYQASNF